MEEACRSGVATRAKRGQTMSLSAFIDEVDIHRLSPPAPGRHVRHADRSSRFFKSRLPPSEGIPWLPTKKNEQISRIRSCRGRQMKIRLRQLRLRAEVDQCNELHALRLLRTALTIVNVIPTWLLFG